MHLDGFSALNISLGFGDDEFNFNSFPGGRSGSICGATYASSSLSSVGPQTPTSSRSTPPFPTSFDFASSFASSADTDPFDMTPPSSAPSTCFSITPEAGNVSDLVYPVFPFTLSRGPLDFSGYPLGGCGNQLTPSQPMDCSFFVGHPGANPLLSTPSGPAQFGQVSDTASYWTYLDSPISFDQQSPTRLIGTVQPIKQEHEDEVTFTPSSTTRKRTLIEEARHRTTVLHQQVQQCSPSPARTRIKREKRALPIKEDSSSSIGKIERAGTFKCPIEGCKLGPYRRSEHMKRHIQTLHQGANFPCYFCPHSSNRRDNWVAHLKLHTQKRPSSGGNKPRVKYVAAAVPLYEEELKKTESRRRRGGKLKKRPDSVE